MLDPQPARRRVSSQGRFGLALAGGGPLGAFYEVGTLHAISEALDGLDLTNLDMYVGVSSGAMIAAGLVNGYDTADMGLVFIHNASQEYPVRPGLFLRPAFREYLRRLNAIPGLAADILAQYLREPGKDWAEAIDPLGRLLPTGLCDNRPFERFLAQMFTGPGRTNDFRELRRSLYIVATELNSGYSVRFGEPGQDHVPISRAIQASTALPGLYPPVEIDDHTYVDGALMRTMNASLLLDEGADFVICINPLVAFDASSAPRRYGDVRTRRPAGGAEPDVPRDDPVAHAGRDAHLQAELPDHRRAAVRARPRRRRAVLQERVPLRRSQAARGACLPAHAARPVFARGHARTSARAARHPAASRPALRSIASLQRLGERARAAHAARDGLAAPCARPPGERAQLARLTP